eukprot:CFRG5995T1
MNMDCIHRLFEQAVASHPEAIAVQLDHTNQFLTYAELNDKAEHIAAALGTLVCKSISQELVAINTDRSFALIVGLLGILKAGAAYVPIDPKYPKHRQNYILTDSQAVALITDSVGVVSATDSMPTIRIDKSGKLLDSIPGTTQKNQRRLPTSSSSLAYVLYTSGSTGNPKGVMVEHGSVSNMLDHFRNDLGVSQTDVILALTTFCFDISALEIFLPLTSGCKMVLASSQTQKDPFSLQNLIQEKHVSIMQATPVTYEMLISIGWMGSLTLTALCGGEAMRPNILDMRFKRFLNVYGPTETCVWSSTYDIPRSLSSLTSNVPIGRPMLNTMFWLCDPSTGSPVNILTNEFGLPTREYEGELFIGGRGVARGYYNRTELTAEKFVTLHGERCYKSGDLVILGVDGEYRFLNRLDSQTKFHGYRIELGEIESCILRVDKQKCIDSAVVIVRNDIPGDALVAYIKTADSSKLDLVNLKLALEDAMPAYMVPKFFVPLLAFPCTPNNKIDRKQLPCPVSLHHNDILTERSSSLSLLPSTKTSTLDAIVAKVISVVSSSTGICTSQFSAKTCLDIIGMDSLGSVLFLKKLADAIGGTPVTLADLRLHKQSIGNLSVHVLEILRQKNPQYLAELHDQSSFTDNADNLIVDDNYHESAITVPTETAEKQSPSLHHRSWKSTLQPTITGIRGVLILWVFFEHFAPFSSYEYYGPRVNVNTFLFFLLSGFTVYLQNGSYKISKWGFIKNKALTMLPILWFGILLEAPLYTRFQEDTSEYINVFTGESDRDYANIWTHVWTYVLYITGMQCWSAVDVKAMFNLWYASTQWNLYLMYPLVIYCLRHKRVGILPELSTSTSTNSKRKCIVAAIILLVAWSAVAEDKIYRLTTTLPFQYLPVFIIGILAAELIASTAASTNSASTSARSYNALSKSKHGRLLLVRWILIIGGNADIMALLLILIIVCPLSAFGAFERIISKGIAFCVIPILFTTFLYAISNAKNTKHSIVLRILHAEVIRNIGTLSYPIYIVHKALGDFYINQGVHPLVDIRTTLQQAWMHELGLVVKLSVLSASFVLAWLLQHYYQNKLVVGLYIHAHAHLRFLHKS